MASIKIRAKLSGDVTTVKALIKHPMDTGLVKDKKTGNADSCALHSGSHLRTRRQQGYDCHVGGGCFEKPLPVIQVCGRKSRRHA